MAAEDARAAVMVGLSFYAWLLAAPVLLFALATAIAWMLPSHVPGIGWASIVTSVAGLALAYAGQHCNRAADESIERVIEIEKE